MQARVHKEAEPAEKIVGRVVSEWVGSGVPKGRVFLLRWGPVLAWMLLIFIASADAESGPRGSRLLVPVIRWLVPDIRVEMLERVVFGVRKVAHFVSFGVLAMLILRAVAGAHPGQWRWRSAGVAWIATTVYAVSDEVHQQYVATRVGSAVDVGIDSLGAVFALGCVRAGRILRRRR